MPLYLAYSIPDHAFLPDESPVRFVLPYLGLRYVCVGGAKPDVKISVTPSNTAHVRLAKPGEVPQIPFADDHVWLRLTGQNLGETELNLEQGSEKLKVKINVMHWRWLHVVFYLVKDGNGQGAFNASHTTAQVKRCDKLYRSQACIDWSRQATKTANIAIDCSKVMTAAEQATLWTTLRSKIPADVKGKTFLHVFCVKDWGGRDKVDSNVWGTSNDNVIIIDDSALTDSGPVLAHELGHSLGLEHSDAVGFVMKQGLSKGPKFTWAEVEALGTFVD